MQENKSFCFCGLALGKRYRDCALAVAIDLQKYHPGVEYLILTDDTSSFKNTPNMIAIKHQQNSVMFPYHDRRFAIKESLARYDIAIQIDTDIRLKKALTVSSLNLNGLKGILGRTENTSQHLKKYQPENLPYYQKVADKLQVDFEKASYVGEFIFAVAKNNGKEEAFIEYWGNIGRYLELNKIHGADGPAIGLAAAKAGLEVIHSDWPAEMEGDFIDHLKFSSGKNKPHKNKLERLKFRLNYHYRLNKTRLVSLKDFNFYYH